MWHSKHFPSLVQPGLLGRSDFSLCGNVTGNVDTTRGFSANTLLLKDPGFRSGPPHPASSSAALPGCRHGLGSVSRASLQVCFCSWMESQPGIYWQWLNAGQQNEREEEGCWPCFKDWLKKHQIFSSGLYVGHQGREKKENLFFLTALFAGLRSLKKLASAIYFPRRAV